MLDKSKIKNIVKTIMESKEPRPVVGAAKAAATQKRVTQNVRSKLDAELKAASPAAEDKAKEKIKGILDSAHEQLSAIFAHEGTPHSVKQLNRTHRITSHLDRVRKSI